MNDTYLCFHAWILAIKIFQGTAKKTLPFSRAHYDDTDELLLTCEETDDELLWLVDEEEVELETDEPVPELTLLTEEEDDMEDDDEDTEDDELAALLLEELEELDTLEEDDEDEEEELEDELQLPLIRARTRALSSAFFCLCHALCAALFSRTLNILCHA